MMPQHYTSKLERMVAVVTSLFERIDQNVFLTLAHSLATVNREKETATYHLFAVTRFRGATG
jgi:hypothetical protein